MKKMIMWMFLSCFFVFAILTSAVPFSVLASNSSDDVMGNVLDSLNEVDPHEDVVVSGLDNVTYEAGRNVNDSNITGNASNRSNDLEQSFRGNNSYLDQLKSFEDLLKSQAAGLKSFENLLKAHFENLLNLDGTLYVAHNDGAKCFVNGAQVLDSLAQPNAAYTNFNWDHSVGISQYLRFGKNVIACEVQNQDNGSTSGGFDAAVTIDGNWVVIPGGDDDMDQSTNDDTDLLTGRCGDNPLWNYWYDGGGGPPPIDSNRRVWYDLNYDDSLWMVGHSPLGDPGGSDGSHNAFACTDDILCQEHNISHAFFRKSFDLQDPSPLLFSFEFLLKKQAAALESFEDLLIAHWDELPLDAKTVLLESFEDLLMSQAEAILSFEELMKKLPVLPPPI